MVPLELERWARQAIEQEVLRLVEARWQALDRLGIAVATAKRADNAVALEASAKGTVKR